MKTALFPGTFDPFTLGHASIVERALGIFDNVLIGIGINASKKNMFTPEERLLQVRSCYLNDPRVEVCIYEGMTSELAAERNINHIIRGIRSASDFEYEKLLADVNDKTAGIETVFLITKPEQSFIQSAVVRDLLVHNQDVSDFVPDSIIKLLKI